MHRVFSSGTELLREIDRLRTDIGADENDLANTAHVQRVVDEFAPSLSEPMGSAAYRNQFRPVLEDALSDWRPDSGLLALAVLVTLERWLDTSHGPKIIRDILGHKLPNPTSQNWEQFKPGYFFVADQLIATPTRYDVLVDFLRSIRCHDELACHIVSALFALHPHFLPVLFQPLFDTPRVQAKRDSVRVARCLVKSRLNIPLLAANLHRLEYRSDSPGPDELPEAIGPIAISALTVYDDSPLFVYSTDLGRAKYYLYNTVPNFDGALPNGDGNIKAKIVIPNAHPRFTNASALTTYLIEACTRCQKVILSDPSFRSGSGNGISSLFAERQKRDKNREERQ